MLNKKSQTVQNNNLTFFVQISKKNSKACTDHYNRRADLDPLQNRSWELHNLENTRVGQYQLQNRSWELHNLENRRVGQNPLIPESALAQFINHVPKSKLSHSMHFFLSPCLLLLDIHSRIRKTEYIERRHLNNFLCIYVFQFSGLF